MPRYKCNMESNCQHFILTKSDPLNIVAKERHLLDRRFLRRCLPKACLCRRRPHSCSCSGMSGVGVKSPRAMPACMPAWPAWLSTDALQMAQVGRRHWHETEPVPWQSGQDGRKHVHSFLSLSFLLAAKGAVTAVTTCEPAWLFLFPANIEPVKGPRGSAEQTGHPSKKHAHCWVALVAGILAKCVCLI